MNPEFVLTGFIILYTFGSVFAIALGLCVAYSIADFLNYQKQATGYYVIKDKKTGLTAYVKKNRN